MAEVAQHDEDTAAFWTQSVFDRNFNVIEGDIRSSGGGRVGSFDGFGFNSLATFDKNNGETVVCSATHSEVVTEPNT